MTNLSMVEKNLVDDLTDMHTGYVLDFTNATFAEFFQAEVGIDIYDNAYFNGSGSKGKRLRAFLDRGEPRAVAKALTALWEYREDWRRRTGQPENVENARVKLSAVIERLGGCALPPSADELSDRGPRETGTPNGNSPSEAELYELRRNFEEMHLMQPQQRGYAFEKLLKAIFELWRLDPNAAFRNTGEQIDGSFWHNSHTYLLEAKWQEEKTNAADLHAFQGKVSERAPARGLFVAYSGYSNNAFSAFMPRHLTLFDGDDIYCSLQRGISIARIINKKERHAVEKRAAMVSVRQLFPFK